MPKLGTRARLDQRQRPDLKRAFDVERFIDVNGFDGRQSMPMVTVPTVLMYIHSSS